jgi:hypothetical protein
VRKAIVILFCLISLAVYSQKDSVRTTFHFANKVDRNNGLSFKIHCERKNEYKEIFVSDNGVSYFFSGTVSGSAMDSANISTDTAIVNPIKRTLDTNYINALGNCNSYFPDTPCGYFLDVEKDGKTLGFIGLDMYFVSRMQCVMDKLQPLIKLVSLAEKDLGKAK